MHVNTEDNRKLGPKIFWQRLLARKENNARDAVTKAVGRRGYFQSEGRTEGRTALILELGGLASLFLAAETVGLMNKVYNIGNKKRSRVGCWADKESAPLLVGVLGQRRCKNTR